MELEHLRMEKEAEAVAAEHAFAVERERLLRQLVASNAEKQRSAEEVRRLQSEKEQIRAQFEEEAAERERILQETLEANKRMAAELEMQRLELLQRPEVAAREVKKEPEETNKLAGRAYGTYKIQSAASDLERRLADHIHASNTALLAQLERLTGSPVLPNQLQSIPPDATIATEG